jgi:hypothetical protein
VAQDHWEEWSAAGVRAATVVEIAANLAIRAEYAKYTTFSAAYVDKLLRFANGLDGKVKRLLLPIFSTAELAKYADIQSLAENINTRRNKVVHQGEFTDCRDDQLVRRQTYLRKMPTCASHQVGSPGPGTDYSGAIERTAARR